MIKHLTIRAKILWIAFAINALCTIVYTVNSYFDQKRIFLTGIDQKLRSAAYALPTLLPDGYHDRITEPDSITPERHRELLNLLTDYASSIGVKYIYSLMKYEGTFREASSSGTAEERKNGPTTPFFTKYEQPPPGLIEAWDTETIRYDEYTDEWGTFRSIFVPMRTAKDTYFLVGVDVSISFIDAALLRMLVVSLFIGAAIFLVVLLLSYSIITRIMAPMANLISYTRGLSDRDFQLDEKQRQELSEIARRRHDEVGKLAQAFSEMQTKLLEYIENLRKTTAAKERIEGELRIAHDIQMSFLPKIFPPFPNRKEFDLYAMIEPAKEVGGDLYDFFLLDDERLFFHVGDVSDKGVPAALFMAVTMTLMKRIAQHKGIDPAEVLRLVNGDLSGENENLLFVTLFCGILNFRTGELLYSNAGHNPPVIARADGTAEWLKLPDGIVLGVMPGAKYSTSTARLNPGDSIIAYTDGVTEAMSVKKELYSEEQLMETALKTGTLTPAEQARRIMESVKAHAAGAPQSDDITILSLKLAAMPG